MRILVTGAGGFVGPYAARALRARPAGVALIGASKDEGALADVDETVTLDICDAEAVRRTIASVAPTHVLHLAGIAAPQLAAADPDLTWRVNVFGTLNLARAILAAAPECVFANVGSGLIYGESARAGTPLDEAALPAPLDDYGVTKAAADLAVGALTRKGLRSIRLRPFNHSGPRQTEDFVAPAFAMQIARIEAGLAEPVLRVGNLESERDFLDVRDVAEAYALALFQAHEIAPGSIFNIASGTAWRISAVLDTLLSFSRVAIRIEQDAARMRPSDIAKVVGNADKARDRLGWTPRHDFAQTLREILEDSRRRVGGR